MNWLSPETLSELETYSGIFRNLALLGGVFVIWKWIASRRDRSTEVLFELESLFERYEIVRARRLIEDDAAYRGIRKKLLRSVLPEDECAQAREERQGQDDSLECLDALLRFYVLLTGVRRSKQIKDSVLRACFRYWLAHYFHPGRRELRLYVDSFFPTLRQWLMREPRYGRGFFSPTEFGWPPARRKVGRDEVRDALRGRVLVLSGAGLSADSGLSTFRGKEGYYRSMRPEDLATRAAFQRDPEQVWEWYRTRQADLRSSRPNPGHEAIARLSELADDCLVATQNVDDLHERAGMCADKLVHVHGELLYVRCESCGLRMRDSSEGVRPCCPRCGEILRPDVVWFDEDLDAAHVERVEQFIAQSAASAVLLVGTSARFDYIADWALRAVGRTGLLIEVNPVPTCISPAADTAVRKTAAACLPDLVPRPAPTSTTADEDTAVTDGRPAGAETPTR